MGLDNVSFAQIVENLHGGLYLVDCDGKITFWNKAAERISGFAADEVVGRSCADGILTHTNSRGQKLCTCGCPLKLTINDAMPREADVYLHHKSGHRILVALRISAMTDAHGKVIGGIELFTDISNQTADPLRLKELEKIFFS